MSSHHLKLPTLSESEATLLGWLGREDSSALGECEGKTLDKLRDLHLVTWDPAIDARQHGYERVILTDSGKAAFKNLPIKFRHR